jgi:uncharacterized protein (TIGR03435 family)
VRLKLLLSTFILAAIASSPAACTSQMPSPTPSAAAAAAALPSFEVATVKPCDLSVSQPVGFYSQPGGRVLLGCATIKMMLYYAYDIQEFQISGGPDWASTAHYTVAALPPDTAASRTAIQPPIGATPSAEQRQMLQSLLADRFGLKCYRSTKPGEVYLLTIVHKSDQLHDPKNKDGDARSNFGSDGWAFGQNISMLALANRLSRDLGRPVLDQTGLTGHYDFNLEANDPSNKDMVEAAFEMTNRLGLKLKGGTGPVDTLVIDHVDRPTAN